MVRILAAAVAALAPLALAEAPVPQYAGDDPLTPGEWWLVVALYVAAATVAGAAWWVWRKKG